MAAADAALADVLAPLQVTQQIDAEAHGLVEQRDEQLAVAVAAYAEAQAGVRSSPLRVCSSSKSFAISLLQRKHKSMRLKRLCMQRSKRRGSQQRSRQLLYLLHL